MKTKIIFLFLLSFLIILGCAGLKKNRYAPPPNEDKTSKVSSETQESPTISSDSNTDIPTASSKSVELLTDDTSETKTPDSIDKTTTANERKLPVTPEPSYETEKVMGWRVQIIACKEKDAEECARLASEEAGKALFEPTYMIQDGSWWKVRIGNCRTRDEAERLKERAIKAGYKDAWLVQSEVVVKK
jgi:cell division septation protein DedD